MKMFRVDIIRQRRVCTAYRVRGHEIIAYCRSQV